MTAYRETHRESARQIQADLNRQADTHRADTHLSHHGRLSRMAHAYVEARTRMDRLRDEVTTDRTTQRTRLERQLFSGNNFGQATATDIIVARDSRDRAAALKNPEDAATQMQLARAAGDTMLEKAVAGVAHRNGWRDVINDYRDNADEYTRSLLNDLDAIPAASTETRLADIAAFRVKAPAELFGKSDDVVRAIADDDDRMADRLESRDRDDDLARPTFAGLDLNEPTGKFRPPPPSRPPHRQHRQRHRQHAKAPATGPTTRHAATKATAPPSPHPETRTTSPSKTWAAAPARITPRGLRSTTRREPLGPEHLAMQTGQAESRTDRNPSHSAGLHPRIGES
jgi:hypothetical protein